MEDSVDCELPQPVSIESTSLIVDFLGFPHDLSAFDLHLAAEEFMHLYNDISLLENCDYMHREIIHIDTEILSIPDEPASENEGEELPFEVIFYIEYECHGEDCADESVLLSQSRGFVDDRRLRFDLNEGGEKEEDYTGAAANNGDGEDADALQYRRNRALEAGCGCDDPDATHDAPRVRQMLRRYRRWILHEEIWELGRPQHILEVRSVDCAPGELDFTSEVYLDMDLDISLFGDSNTIAISQSEEDILAASFLTAFNFLEEVSCNPTRLVHLLSTDVTLETEDVRMLTKETSSSDENNQDDGRDLQIVSIRYLLFLTGKCYGCESEEYLYNDTFDSIYTAIASAASVSGLARRRGLLRSTQITSKSFTPGARRPGRRRTRRLQEGGGGGFDDTEGICFCAVRDSEIEFQQISFHESLAATLEDEYEDGLIQTLRTVQDVEPRHPPPPPPPLETNTSGGGNQPPDDDGGKPPKQGGGGGGGGGGGR